MFLVPQTTYLDVKEQISKGGFYLVQSPKFHIPITQQQTHVHNQIPNYKYQIWNYKFDIATTGRCYGKRGGNQVQYQLLNYGKVTEGHGGCRLHPLSRSSKSDFMLFGVRGMKSTNLESSIRKVWNFAIWAPARVPS